MDHSSAINNYTAERYLLGELNEVDRDAYEEHFFCCPDCAAEVRSASEFMESARHFAQNDIKAELYAPARRPAWKNWLNFKALLQPVPAMACLMLAAVIGLMIPGLNHASLEFSTLAPEELRASRAAVPVLSISRHESLVIPFSIPQAKGDRPYEVALQAQSNGKVLRTQEISAQMATKQLTLRVPAGSLEPGRYDLLIKGVGEKTAPDRYPFELKFQD